LLVFTQHPYPSKYREAAVPVKTSYSVIAAFSTTQKRQFSGSGSEVNFKTQLPTVEGQKRSHRRITDGLKTYTEYEEGKYIERSSALNNAV
jgi:hypothetical protein